MKVLYVACNPKSADDLVVDLEITQLQQLFLGASGEPVHFISFPNLSIEQFPIQLARYRPDVLHISAHGEKNELMLAHPSGKGQIALTGNLLTRFLDYNGPPRLVYLNACNSAEIAKELRKLIPMSIGTTAPITNRTALNSAILFYDRLLTGDSVWKAFDVGCAMIETLQNKAAKSVLERRDDVDPKSEVLHRVPEIIARFFKDKCKPDAEGDFDVEVGVVGCPHSTIQIVVFTDDKTFLPDEDDEDDEDRFERQCASSMCRVIRGRPVRQILWSEESEFIFGNYRLYAAGVTATGDVFAVTSKLTDALVAYYQRFSSEGDIIRSDAFKGAISALKSNDGSGLTDVPQEKRSSKSTQRKPPGAPTRDSSAPRRKPKKT
jgi:hypothetical protein